MWERAAFVAGVLLAVVALWRDEGPARFQPPPFFDLLGVLPWWGTVLVVVSLAFVLVFEASFRRARDLDEDILLLRVENGRVSQLEQRADALETDLLKANEQLQEVESRRRKPFRLSAVEALSPFTTNPREMYADVRVENISDMPLTDVEVRVMDVVSDLERDENGKRTKTLLTGGWQPCFVRWASTDQERMTIPQHDSRNARLILGVEGATPCVWNSTPPVIAVTGDYRVDVRVTSPGHEPLDASFYADIHPIQEVRRVRNSEGAEVYVPARSPGIGLIDWGIHVATQAILAPRSGQ